MGNLSLMEIRDFSNEEAVITPVLKVSTGKSALSLDQMMDNVDQLFEHKKFYARCTCDIQAHL